MKHWIGLSVILLLTISFSQAHDLIYYCEQYNLTTFLQLLNTAGLTSTLSAADGGTGAQYTVFAPTNQAFANFQSADPGAYDQLTSDMALLTNVLSYHVTPGSHPTSSLVDNSALVMLNSQITKINVFNGTYPGYTTTVYTINNALLIVMDIVASNGILQIIDKVLIPPTLAISSAINLAGLSTFNALLAASGIQLDPNQNYTYLVPTNEAFAALGVNGQLLLLPQNQAILASLLKNMIIPGVYFSNELIENGVTVTALSGMVLNFDWDASINRIIIVGTNIHIVVADILATNGIIQVIDGVVGASTLVIPTSQTAIPTSQTTVPTSETVIPTSETAIPTSETIATSQTVQTSQTVVETSNLPQVVPAPAPASVPTSEAVVPTFVPTVPTSKVIVVAPVPVTTQPPPPATTGIILLPPGFVNDGSIAGPIAFLVGLVVLMI